MEGNQTGNIPSQPVVGAAGEDDLILIWPEKLIAELADRKLNHPWSPALSIINFVLMSLIALFLGPAQLILMVIIQDLVTVTEGYYPAVLRVSLMLSGLIAISTIITTVQAWREQPKQSFSVSILGAGTMLLGAVIWFTAYITRFQPHELTLLLLLIIIGTIAFALVLRKKPLIRDHRYPALNTLFVIAILFGGAETIFSGLFMLNQTETVADSQIALEELKLAQEAARTDGVSDQTSDLVYTLCGSEYNVVYMKSGSTTSGLFECRGSYEVYSVSGPNEVSKTSMQAAAFYFGKDQDSLVSTYLPPETGVHYLYRDLGAAGDDSVPSELVLLLPAASEEVLINLYLAQITSIVNARPKSNPLSLSIFYTAETNNILTTKDYILIGAMDTLANTTYLPRGTNYKAYYNGVYGTFIFTPDSVQAALTELAASPMLYSSQTLDALTNRRHISVTLEADREYTEDELREIFYAQLVSPRPDEAEPQNAEPQNEEAAPETPAE